MLVWRKVDQVLLYCYQYNPQTGRYSASILNLVRAGAVLTVLALGGFMLTATARRRGKARRACSSGACCAPTGRSSW